MGCGYGIPRRYLPWLWWRSDEEEMRGGMVMSFVNISSAPHIIIYNIPPWRLLPPGRRLPPPPLSAGPTPTLRLRSATHRRHSISRQAHHPSAKTSRAKLHPLQPATTIPPARAQRPWTTQTHLSPWTSGASRTTSARWIERARQRRGG